MFFFVVGRSAYIPLRKHWQILNHQTEQNDNCKVSYRSSNDRESCSTSSSQSLYDKQNESITSAQNSVVYIIYGFKHSTIRKYLFHILSILLIGIPYLLIKWFKAALYIKYRKCDLSECDVVFGKTS